MSKLCRQVERSDSSQPLKPLVDLIVAFGFFYPRQRLRFEPRLYWRRLADSIYTAGAEVLFYLQMEFDKLLVLSLGGPTLAGIYAILMRLVDLTAIPIRTFSMMLVQRIMRAPGMLSRLKLKAIIELGIFVASTLAILVMAVLLYLHPTLLGRNVAEVAPLLMLAISRFSLRLCGPQVAPETYLETHFELLLQGLRGADPIDDRQSAATTACR